MKKIKISSFCDEIGGSMKRNILNLALLVLSLSLLLCACGNETTTETKSTETEATATLAEHAHSFSSWEIVKEATCTDDGLRKRTCACGYIEQNNIPQTDHNWMIATCVTAKKCSKCGMTEGETTVHEWEKASCTQPKTCKICDATEGSSLGHSWNEATCTQPKTCSRCKTTSGSALGHNMSGGVCKTCNYVDQKAKELASGTFVFTGLYNSRGYLNDVADDISKAMYFTLNKSLDYVSTDRITAFAKYVGLKDAVVRDALVKLLQNNGENVNEYNMSYALLYNANNSVNTVLIVYDEYLNEVKNLIVMSKGELEEMSGTYDSITGFKYLQNYYNALVDYYNFIINPQGSYSEVNETLQNLIYECSKYEKILKEIYY